MTGFVSNHWSSVKAGCVHVLEILEYPGKWNEFRNILECPGIWFHVLEYPGKISPFRNKRKKWDLVSVLWIWLLLLWAKHTHTHIQHVQSVKYSYKQRVNVIFSLHVHFRKHYHWLGLKNDVLTPGISWILGENTPGKSWKYGFGMRVRTLQ